MNRVILLIVTMLLSYNTMAQTRQELENIIAAINAQLPLSLGPSGEIQAMTLSGNTMNWDIAVNDFGKSVGSSRFTPVAYRDMFLTLMPASFIFAPETAGFIQKLTELNIGLRLNVTSEVSGKSVTVNISVGELTNMLNNEPDFKKVVRYQIENTKASFPMQANNMTFTNCELKNGYMVTTIIVDEAYNSMDLLEQNKDFTKQQMVQMVNQQVDLTFNINLFYCCMAEYGFAYDYVGSTSKKRVRIGFTPEEIVMLLAPEDDGEVIEEIEYIEE